MTRLVAVIVDGLLAEDDDARSFLVYDALQDFGDCERLDISLRKGALRVSPHLYNTHNDIDGPLDVKSTKELP